VNPLDMRAMLMHSPNQGKKECNRLRRLQVTERTNYEPDHAL